MNDLSEYEINLLGLGLQSLESDLCRQWERAQKAAPYGARATSLKDRLAVIRKLADKVSQAEQIAAVRAKQQAERDAMHSRASMLNDINLD